MLYTWYTIVFTSSMNFFQIQAILLPILIFLDLSWARLNIHLISENTQRIQKGTQTRLRWWAIPLVYASMLAAVAFVCEPLVGVYGIWGGMLVGYVIHAIYNLCNYIAFEEQSTLLCVIDTLWGMVLYTSLTAFSIFLAKA